MSERPFGYGLGPDNVPYPIHTAEALLAYLVESGAEWPRQVAHTEIDDVRGVDTTFIGMGGILFETAILDGTIRPVDRYATWEDAEAGHARWVNELRSRPRYEGQ